MLRTIHLHGALAEFGESYTLDVRDASEACRAIGVQVPGFRKAVEEGRWHVFRGPLDAENDLSREDVHMSLGGSDEIHILPAAEGAGEVFNVIAGVTLFAVGVFTGNPGLIYAGGAMALGGVASLLTSPPTTDSYSDRERPEERPSFLFDGPTNTSTQGLPVPLVYGRMRVGSIVVSASLTAEEIDITPDDNDESGK